MLAPPAGPLAWSLIRGPGEVARGAWGEAGGSLVNKTRARAGESPPGDKTGPFFFFLPRRWRGRRPQGVHWPFLSAGYHNQGPLLGALFTPSLPLWGISLSIIKQILIAPEAARWFPPFASTI